MAELIFAIFGLWLHRLFSSATDWAASISAGADVVMALAAVYASWAGIRQYRRSVKAAELDHVSRLHEQMQELHALIDQAGDKPKKVARRFLNFFELYAGAYNGDHLSGFAKAMVFDMLNEELRDLSKLEVFQELLKEAENKGPRALGEVRKFLESAKR